MTAGASSIPLASSPSDHNNRENSSAFSAFIHRRAASNGEALSPERRAIVYDTKQPSPTPLHGTMVVGHFAKNNPGALGELQQNQQESAPRSPTKHTVDNSSNLDEQRSRSRSPTKGGPWSHISLRSTTAGKESKPRDVSPSKPKKPKSSTNLASLLTRPKSLKNLYRAAADDDDLRVQKDKENRTPVESPSAQLPPPIFAQFTHDDSLRNHGVHRASADVPRGGPFPGSNLNEPPRPAVKDRPRSFQVTPRLQQDRNVPSSVSGAMQSNQTKAGNGSEGDSSGRKSLRSRRFQALPGFGHLRSKSATPVARAPRIEPTLDVKDIDRHLEAMLDRRNIPENQRYKMRNLNDTIKMEFIRQDWAEMQAAKGERSFTGDSVSSADVGSTVVAGSDLEDEKPKQTRGRSFTFRSKKDPTSPSKKQKSEGTLGRHFRSKSSESVVSERPSSACSTSSTSNFFSKVKPQQGPAEYVAYLRKVQKPESVEVGKLHKLRLLLRNETVAWIEDFMQQGGMKEIVDLLKRVMEVEWREEHEDALLHENLLCLKALSTTARGMQYLHTIQADLFPKLLHMLFDPERKGPSEFTTRSIITTVIFAYIQSAPPSDRTARASNVLGYLRDPEPKDTERPLPFVLEMRKERPYRVWCKEVVSVTKEVFWIFLHNLNVVSLPSEKYKTGAEQQLASSVDGEQALHMSRHFPQERPPVPAAPYVGGVEWDATNYIASHLDLMNAILACVPTVAERNALRRELRISGWERCLGGSLRLCKEKFYGSVHDGLRTWVAAAADDGWDVRDVRYGPPPESRASPKKHVDDAPKLDMPKLDFNVDQAKSGGDAWL